MSEVSSPATTPASKASTIPQITCPQCESSNLQVQDIPAKVVPKGKRIASVIWAIIWLLIGVACFALVFSMWDTGAGYFYGPFGLWMLYLAYSRISRYRRLGKAKQFTCEDCHHSWTPTCSKCPDSAIEWTPARFDSATGEDPGGSFVFLLGAGLTLAGLAGVIYWFNEVVLSRHLIETSDWLVLTIFLGIASFGLKFLAGFRNVRNGFYFKCHGCKHKWRWIGR